MIEPLVSIIIPAYNEQERIVGALESANRQTYDRIETIVVANNCRDDTAKIAEGLATKVIKTPRQGISHTKNLGIENAEESILSFLDADSEMEDDLIEKMLRSARGVQWR